MLIHNKDDIEFVTKLPCFLGHPVFSSDPQFIELAVRFTKVSFEPLSD